MSAVTTYKKAKKVVSLMTVAVVLLFAAFLTIGAVKLFAQDTTTTMTNGSSQVQAPAKKPVSGLAAIAAGLAVGLGSIGAGIAVGQVGAAAIGVIGEKPELLGKTLIYLGLAEGIAIYGLVIAILVLLT